LRTQLLDLLAVQQQLAGTAGRVVGPRAEGVLGDVHVDQPHLPVLHRRVAVGERGTPCPQGLDLRALQHDARLVDVLDVVVVAGPLVLGDDLTPVLTWHGYEPTGGRRGSGSPRGRRDAEVRRPPPSHSQVTAEGDERRENTDHDTEDQGERDDRRDVVPAELDVARQVGLHRVEQEELRYDQHGRCHDPTDQPGQHALHDVPELDVVVLSTDQPNYSG